MERPRRVDNAKIAISEIERLVRELEQFKSSSMGNSIDSARIENVWDFRPLTLLGHVFSMGRSTMGRAHPRVVASTACHFAHLTTAYNTSDGGSHSQIGPVFASNSTSRVEEGRLNTASGHGIMKFLSSIVHAGQ